MFLPANTILPKLEIGNITLGKNNINIKGFFVGKDSMLQKLIQKNSKLASYIEVYFYLSVPHHKGKILPANILVNPEKRIQNIAGYFRKSSLNVIKWHKHLSKIYPNTSVGISKIFENKKAITESSISGVASLKDLNFEVNLPISESLYDRKDVSEVRVHAFAHLDVNAMIEAGEIKKINNSLGKYFLLGSNLKSKIILTMSNDRLLPPMTKTVLVGPDGKGYFGPVKKYSNGRVVGVRKQGVLDVPLTKVETQEKNISPEYFIDKMSSPPVSPSFKEKESKLEYSYSKPIYEVDKPQVSEMDDELYKTGYIARKKAQANIEKIKNTPTGFITNAYHYINVSEGPANSINFELQWEKIIRNKAHFGYLIDMVKGKESFSTILKDGNFSGTSLSSETIVGKCHIKEITIKRDRISEGVLVSNAVGTEKKKKRPQAPSTTLARIENFNFTKGYEDANVSFKLYPEKSNYAKKCLVLRDMELYSKPKKGEYSYSIEIIFEEKIVHYLKQILNNFQNNLKQYDIFLQELDTKRAHIEGKDKFNTKNLSFTEYNSSLAGAVDQYLLILCWLGKEITEGELRILRNSIMTSVMPDLGGTVTGAYSFRTKCDSIAHDLKKLISMSGFSILEENATRLKNNKHVSSKEVFYKKHTFTIPGYTKSIEDGQVMLAYPQDLSTQSTHTGRQAGNGGLLSLEPNAYMYKNEKSLKTILTKREVLQNTTAASRKAMILDNAIKQNDYGSIIEAKIKIKDPLPEMSMAFGISGITLAIPSSTGTFLTEKGKARPTEATLQDLDSSLTKVLDTSIAASTRKKTGKDKIKEQNKAEKRELEISKRKSSILDKAIGVLSCVRDHEPLNKEGSSKKPKLDRKQTPVEKIFKNKSGVIKVGLKDGSGEMMFVPVSVEVVQRIKSRDVVIMVERPIDEKRKEKYIAVNNVFEISKTALLEILKQVR